MGHFWAFACLLLVDLLPTSRSKSKSTITKYYEHYNGAIDFMCCGQDRELGWSYRKCMVSKESGVTAYKADILSSPCLHLANASSFQDFSYFVCNEVNQTKRACAVHCVADQIYKVRGSSWFKAVLTTWDTRKKAQNCYSNVYGKRPQYDNCEVTPFTDVQCD